MGWFKMDFSYIGRSYLQNQTVKIIVCVCVCNVIKKNKDLRAWD